MKLPFPVLAPLPFIQDAVKQLDYKLHAKQAKNLILVLSAIVISGSMCLSTISLALLQNISTSALSHFFSYAGLNGELLMASALRWAVSKIGKRVSVRLLVDDTMKHHSRGCQTIKGVYWLFDHVLQTYCKAKCVVFVYMVLNERVRFPIGWRVYRKGGPSKWKLAIELIDEARNLGLNISVVLFDSWFCVNGFIKGLEERELRFIGDIKGSNTLEYGREGHPDAEVVLSMSQLFKYGKSICKRVLIGLKSSDQERRGEKALYETYGTVAYVRAFNGKYLIINSIDQRTGKSKLLISNELTWEAQKVLEEYSYRWMIEEFFGNIKGLCGFEGACIRSEQGGALALFLVSFVDLLVSIKLWEGIHGNSEGKLPTVSAIFAIAAEENLQHLLKLSEQPERFKSMLEVWLRVIQKKSRETRRERRGLVQVEGGPEDPNTTERSQSSRNQEVEAA